MAFRSRLPRRRGLTVAAAAAACFIAWTAPVLAATATTARTAPHRPHARWNPLAHPALFSGDGFDTCSAPPLSAMQAWWRSSGYRALGLYIGGVNRACDSTNLNHDWVRAVDRIGWRLIPIYVGHQAPCVRQARLALMDSKAAADQATAAANDAVAAAASLGLVQGSVVYFDLEAYRRGDPACAGTTLKYLGTWVQVLHAHGYLAGIYSSAGSGITDLAAAPGAPPPDAVWIARWNGGRTLDDPALPNGMWGSHQRIKQYTNGHKETYGGVGLRVDKNLVDGPVARIG